MTPEEAQQAQTIAECRQWLENQLRKVQSRGDYSAWPSEDSANRIIHLLEIVDSQAQKIAEQAKEIEILQRIKRAAISAEYYQGTEGTAQELEDALKMTTDQTTDSKEVV